MSEEPTYTIDERRICWPDPDATCLNGGCSWCNTHPFRKISTIERYANKAGVLPHRGKGEDDAVHAFRYGLAHHFFNVETRTSRENLVAWLDTVQVLALKAMAEGMPGTTHGKTRAQLVPWLLRYRRMTLNESFRKTYEGRLR